MRNSQSSFQEQFFSRLLEHTSKSELVALMESHLHLSKATCYKYINGTTDISYNQMAALREILPQRVAITINDEVDPGLIKWTYPPFLQEMDIQHYLDGLLSYLRILDISNTEIIMTTYEIPIFYYMFYPELFAFKLYCWSKTIWMSSDFFADKFYAQEILTPHIRSSIIELCDRYNSISAAEYWTANMMSNTVRQITYFRDAEMFKNIQQIKKLTQDLYSLSALMRKMMEKGRKFLSDQQTPGAVVKIAQNDIYYTNNIFIARGGDKSYVFSSFDNPNYIFSTDGRIIQKTLHWIGNMDRHCMSLTEGNEKVRSDFFNQLNQPIELLAF